MGIIPQWLQGAFMPSEGATAGQRHMRLGTGGVGFGAYCLHSLGSIVCIADLSGVIQLLPIKPKIFLGKKKRSEFPPTVYFSVLINWLTLPC